MDKFLEALQEFGFVLVIGIVTGILYVIKGYEKRCILTRGEHIRYVINGVLGSMFLTWLGYELFCAIGLNTNLSVALGGLLAYLGTDKVAELFEKFIIQKIGGDKK